MSQELPVIENSTPIVVSEVVIPEKVFDKMWVTEFVVNSDNPNATRLYAIVRPYCSATNEILVQAGTEKVISLDDLFGILQGTKIEPKLSPETIAMGGQLMGLTLMFVNKVLADKAQPDPEPEVVEPEVPYLPDEPVTPPEELITE